MNQMNQMHDDEINLFALSQTLWDGKWLIGAFVAVAALLGVGYVALTDPAYESRVYVSINNPPPSLSNIKQESRLEQKIYSDFQTNFYSKKIFENWKASYPNASLVFEDINKTRTVNGFNFAKDKSETLLTFNFSNSTDSFILVKTNTVLMLMDIFNYSNHINELLTRRYVDQTKHEIQRMTGTTSVFGENTKFTILESVLWQLFSTSIQNEAWIFTIENPSNPQLVSPKLWQIAAYSVILGGIVGAFFVLVSNVVKKQKNKYLANV